VPGHVCRAWSAKEERDALVREGLAQCAAPGSTVAVIWHTSQPGLSIRASDLAAHAGAVLEGWGDTVWIVASGGGSWLIEIAYWDREVCWSRHMPDPEARPATGDSL
jgi:hypothetical protein